MKRTLTLLVLVSLMASPNFAYGQEGVGPEGAKTAAATRSADTVDADELLISAETLFESVVTAAREVVSADVAALAPPQGEGGKLGSGPRIAIGLAMIVGGAAIIWKGFDIYESDERFGRTTNGASYMAWGTGATIAFFGGFVLRGGLQGDGFQ